MLDHCDYFNHNAKVGTKKIPAEKLFRRVGVGGSSGGSFTPFRYYGGSFGSFWVEFGGVLALFGGGFTLRPANGPSSGLYSGSRDNGFLTPVHCPRAT